MRMQMLKYRECADERYGLFQLHETMNSLSNQNRQVLVSDRKSTSVRRPPHYEAQDIAFPEEI